MSRSARSKDGLFVTLVASAAIAIASLCSGVILARSLSPDLRGILATIILWPTMLGVFCDLGLGFAVSYFIAKEPQSGSALWTTSLIYGLGVGTLVGVIGAWVLPLFLGLTGSYVHVLRLAMWIVPAGLVSSYASMLLLGANWIREYNLVRAYLTVSYALGIVILAISEHGGVDTYALSYVAAQLSGAVLATVLVLWRIRPQLAWSASLLRPLFAYGAKTYVSSIVAQTNLRLDQMIMSAMVPFAELGKYVVAVAMSSTVGPLYTTLAIVALPRVAHHSDPSVGALEGKRYFQLGILAGFPLAILGILSMPWLLPLLFGNQYPGAVLPAQILMLASISQGLNLVLGNSLRALGRPGLPAIAEGFGVIVTVALLLLLLPILGATGAAVTSLLAYSTVMFAQMTFINHAAQLTWSAWWMLNWQDFLPNASLSRIRRRLADN